MREQFEKLPEIARHMHKLIFQDDLNCYRNKIKSSDIHLVTWVNGAWYAFQKQQAIINDLKAQLENMEACYIEKKKQVEAVEHILGCAMIGPKEVFQYADRIGKALRGANEDT